ncbi:MAG: pentapeptide repeat-containing protein [Pseudomonadales bacterium]|nr:pentapeptide repeat-containing protein [Pseudomonadales bacterium]
MREDNKELINRWKTDVGRSYRQKILSFINDYDALERIADEGFGVLGDLIDMRGISLCGISMFQAELTYCDLAFSDFTDAEIVDSIFAYSDVSHARFERVKISGSTLVNIVSNQVSFKDSMIRDTSMNGGCFKASDLSFTEFKNVDLSLCDFSGALFEEVVFDNVSLAFSKISKNQEKWISENSGKYDDALKKIEWL